MGEPVCPRCRRSISPDETIAFDDDQIVHLDCRQPFELSYPERALLFMFCWSHPVATCAPCDRSFCQDELASDLFDHRTHLCPRCHTDLTASIRGHLFACALVPTEVRWRAEDARDATRRLIKQRHQLSSRAEVLIHEVESAMAALRDAMKRVTWGN